MAAAEQWQRKTPPATKLPEATLPSTQITKEQWNLITSIRLTPTPDKVQVLKIKDDKLVESDDQADKRDSVRLDGFTSSNVFIQRDASAFRSSSQNAPIQDAPLTYDLQEIEHEYNSRRTAAADPTYTEMSEGENVDWSFVSTGNSWPNFVESLLDAWTVAATSDAAERTKIWAKLSETFPISENNLELSLRSVNGIERPIFIFKQTVRGIIYSRKMYAWPLQKQEYEALANELKSEANPRFILKQSTYAWDGVHGYAFLNRRNGLYRRLFSVPLVPVKRARVVPAYFVYDRILKALKHQAASSDPRAIERELSRGLRVDENEVIPLSPFHNALMARLPSALSYSDAAKYQIRKWAEKKLIKYGPRWLGPMMNKSAAPPIVATLVAPPAAPQPAAPQPAAPHSQPAAPPSPKQGDVPMGIPVGETVKENTYSAAQVIVRV